MVFLKKVSLKSTLAKKLQRHNQRATLIFFKNKEQPTRQYFKKVTGSFPPTS